VRWERAPRGLRSGFVEDWPAHHVFVEFARERTAEAAAFLWEKIARVHAIQAAYNIEAAFLPSGHLRTFLFPRAPGPEITLEGSGTLSPNFGGWELTGDIVVPTREIFAWIQAHPDLAARMTHDRLRVTTRPVP
jgi:hypothetical protein